ncbi:MAG: diguanylate cyclase [Chloroflexi bacterium]|nr:diguanylate cyclase [Chloroflexota bacterium]
MRKMLQKTAAIDPEDFARYKAYDRLNAISDILTISVVMFFSYFLPTQAFYQVAIYGLCVFMAIFSLLWHSLLPERFLGPTKLLAKSLIDTLFVTLLIQYTGEEQSPFFFLYYLVLLAVALSLGVRYTFLMSGVMTIAFVVMSGVAILRLILEPKAFIVVWAYIVSLWLVAYLAAFLASEAEKARKRVSDAKSQVENFSRVDWLTGLYNMKHFDTVSAQELARAERYGHPLSVMMLDSDNLKLINDRHGHQRGDQHIMDLSRTITHHCRVSDTAIRYGGDEFIMLMPETDTMGARFLAERIRAAVEEQGLEVNGRTVPTTVSIGIASTPKDATDAMGLVARADAALYASKEAGRNRVTIFMDGMSGERWPVVNGHQTTVQTTEPPTEAVS